MNLLVTGAWKNAKEYLNQLEQMGNRVQFLQYEKDDLPCEYNWVEGVICNGLFLHHPIEKFSRLRYVQLTSAGYDRVPMEYIRDRGIEVYNAKGVYSIPMAEWAVMSILEIYKNAYSFYRKKQQKIWEKDHSLLELTDKKVCIIGYGSVGREIAKRLSVFGTIITAVNRSRIEDDLVHKWISLEQIDEALPEADIVILCIALTKETRKLFHRNRFNNMKKGSVLVNISRGELIEEKELLHCIQEGKIRGASLDVFEKEPLSTESELWDEPRVIVNPHNSFVGDKISDRMFKLICKNLKNLEI